MSTLEDLKINLKELKDVETRYEFSLDDSFFAAIDAPDVKKGTVAVDLLVRKTAEQYFELNFHIEGKVAVECNLCLDEMEQAIESNNSLVVKFGEEYSEDDDLVTVEESEGIIDVAWFVYEFIVLSIPIRHVHAPGNCNAEMMKVLNEHSATRSGDGQEAVDPRWSGLEKLKTIIKD